MNKYGFGLKESMLFLVTICICIFITMFMYNKTFKEIFEGTNEGRPYSYLENDLKNAGATYIQNYYKVLKNGDEGYVGMSTIQEKNLINNLVDKKGQKCRGYIFFKRNNNKTNYVPYIKCGNNYKTDGYNSSHE